MLPSNNSDKIKNIIENSESFAILLANNPEEHEFLLSEVLAEALSLQNKPTFVPSAKETNTELKEKWASLLQTRKKISFPQRTTIKLPKNNFDIDQVSYKEESDYLSFIITSKDNYEITKESISTEKLPPQADAVFCFFEDETKINDFQNIIKFPGKEKIIFITASEKTLTEKIFGIIKIIDSELISQKTISDLLFASLLAETNGFSFKISKETLRLGGGLLENESQKEDILRILNKENTSSFVQIFGRALARTYTDESLKTSWSFLNYKDFQKTNNTPPSIQLIRKIIKRTKQFVNQSFCALLWQTTAGIMITFTFNRFVDKKYFLSLAEKTQTKNQSDFLTVGPFENFSLAETYMREILKKEIIN